jgi:hypothetical protein
VWVRIIPSFLHHLEETKTPQIQRNLGFGVLGYKKEARSGDQRDRERG